MREVTVKLTDGIHSLNQYKSGHVQAFLLGDGNQSTLIHPLYIDDGVCSCRGSVPWGGSRLKD
jgi:hypothetical protein